MYYYLNLLVARSYICLEVTYDYHSRMTNNNNCAASCSSQFKHLLMNIAIFYCQFFVLQVNLKKFKFSLPMSNKSTTGTVEFRVYSWYYRKKVGKNLLEIFLRFAEMKVSTKGYLNSSYLNAKCVYFFSCFSTWTIDLCYLLRKFNVRHSFYTTTLGIHEGYRDNNFYHNVLTKVSCYF